MKKLSVVVLIAVAFFTTSCVDNTVSPQVEAIRGQQVEWMKAKVAAEAALTAMTNADAAYRNAEAADKISQTAIAAALAAETLKQQQAINANVNLTNDEKLRALKALNAQNELTATMLYNQAKADNEVKYAIAQTALATEKVNLANATAALVTATANANSASAIAYLAKYTAAANNVALYSGQKLDNTKKIADYSLAVTFAGTNAGLLTQTYNNSKAKEQVNLAAHTAALAVYQAIATTPSSIQIQIDNLTKTNVKYQASIDSCTLAITNKTNDYNAKFAAYTAAQTIISDFTTLKYTTYISQQNDSINKETVVADDTKIITTATATLATSNTDVTNKLATYNDAKATSDAKQKTYNGLKTLSDGANVTLQTDINKTSNAKADYDVATINVTSTTTALTTANTALTTANTNVTNASTTLATAIANLTTANINLAANPLNTLLVTAQAIAQSQKDAAQTALTNAQTALTAAIDTQAAADAAKTSAIAAQTAAKVPYDAAVAAQATAQKAYDTALAKTSDANTVLVTAIGITAIANTAYTNAITAASTSQTALNTAKANLTNAQNALIDSKSKCQVLINKINATFAAYNTALTTYASLNTTQQAATDELTKLTTLKATKSTLWTYNENVKTTLGVALISANGSQASIDAENAAISASKTIIAGLDNQIATLDTTDLSGINSAKTWLNNEIAKFGKNNDALDILIATASEQVTYYKGLLDKLFA